MQKVLCSDDIMEFKINQRWIRGFIKDIDISEKKFILSIENSKDNNLVELQNQPLLINNYTTEYILQNLDQDFSQNQIVEFFDDSSNSWIGGTIKTKNNDFYIISYLTKDSYNNSKIVYKNNIRPVTTDNNILSLNLNNAQCYSLKNFEIFSDPMKYARKFIKRLINLLNREIFYIFLNSNFDLFIFTIENKNENDNLINNEVINGLIDIAYKHFENVDKVNKKLFK